MATVLLGILAIAAWLALEVVLRPAGSAASLERERTDRASTVVLVAGYALAAGLPALFDAMGVREGVDLAWIGVAVAAGGVLLRAWGMRTLGAAYTRTLRTSAGQQIVTDGPYRWIRHPGYAGSLAVWVGATLSFHSAVAAAVVVCVLGLAYAWRIRSEERMLDDAFGPAYAAWAARTARLIPGLF